MKSTVVPDTFQGKALEDRVGGTCKCKDPIKQGTYPAIVRTGGPLGWRIELIGVPNYTHVQIHVGNDAGDVEGCFAAGMTATTDFVANSSKAMQEIKKIVQKDGGKITVTIVGNGSRVHSTGQIPVPGRKPKIK